MKQMHSIAESGKAGEYISVLFDRREFWKRLSSLKMFVTAVVEFLIHVFMVWAFVRMTRTQSSPVEVKEIMVSYLGFQWKVLAFWYGAHVLDKWSFRSSAASIAGSGFRNGTSPPPSDESGE